MATGRPRPVIGWREWVRLPELGILQVKAKIDTGARTSSLHAFDIQVFERRGRAMVRFKVHPTQRSTKRVIETEAPLADQRWVRNTSGRAERRLVIRTALELDQQSWPIEISLARREMMGFRMLLGRQAVRNRFLVDPGRSFLAARRRRRITRSKGKRAT